MTEQMKTHRQAAVEARNKKLDAHIARAMRFYNRTGRLTPKMINDIDAALIDLGGRLAWAEDGGFYSSDRTPRMGVRPDSIPRRSKAFWTRSRSFAGHGSRGNIPAFLTDTDPAAPEDAE